MGKFEQKIKKMEDKLKIFEIKYGFINHKTYVLRRKLEIYKYVATLSHKDVGEQLSYAAGEIEKLKSGYYYYATSVDSSRKLLNVLRERIKSDNKDANDEIKSINNTDLDMIGCTIEDKEKGGFIDG